MTAPMTGARGCHFIRRLKIRSRRARRLVKALRRVRWCSSRPVSGRDILVNEIDAALRHSSGDRAGIARCGWLYRGFVDRNRLSYLPSCRSVQLGYRRKEKAIGHICEFAREIPISGHLLACCRPEPNQRSLLPYFDLLRVEISLKRLRKPRRAGKRSRLRLMRSLEGQRQRSRHFNDEYQ